MLSIVIPARSEAENLPILHREIADVARQKGIELEVIFVDDGSTDDTWRIIEGLAGEDRRVRGIRFRRNFGKTAALSAGFAVARGETVMTMDADLQDDPCEIPRFLETMAGGFDVVCGWRKQRNDPFGKTLPSRVFNALVNRLMGLRLHDHNCGFKCYKRGIFQEIRLYGELHRFVPVLAAARGFRVGEIPVHHRSRVHGVSKYGAGRFLKGLLDLLTVYFLTSFEQRPQHFLGAIGLVSFGVGSIGIITVSALWIVTRLDNWGMIGTPIHDSNIFERAIDYFSLLAVLLGAQFLAIALLAALLTAKERKGDALYSIQEQAGAS